MSLEEDAQRQADHTRKRRAELLAGDEWLRSAVREFNGVVAEAAQLLRSRQIFGTPVASWHGKDFMGKPKHTLTRLRAWVPTGLCANTYAFTDEGLYPYAEFVFEGNGALKKREGRAAGLVRYDKYVVLGAKVEDMKDYDEVPGSNKLGQYRASTWGTEQLTLRLATPDAETATDPREWLTKSVASLLP